MLLSKTGVFYMVTVEENKPKEIGKMMRDYGFSMEVLFAFGEELLYRLMMINRR